AGHGGGHERLAVPGEERQLHAGHPCGCPARVGERWSRSELASVSTTTSAQTRWRRPPSLDDHGRRERPRTPPCGVRRAGPDTATLLRSRHLMTTTQQRR